MTRCLLGRSRKGRVLGAVVMLRCDPDLDGGCVWIEAVDGGVSTVVWPTATGRALTHWS